MGNTNGPRAHRRYVRVPGPFEGYYVGHPGAPVLIYELNLGGGFVTFLRPPEDARLRLRINLPDEGSVTVNAETIYRHQFGVAVRFVDVDPETAARLSRTVDGLTRDS